MVAFRIVSEGLALLLGRIGRVGRKGHGILGSGGRHQRRVGELRLRHWLIADGRQCLLWRERSLLLKLLHWLQGRMGDESRLRWALLRLKGGLHLKLKGRRELRVP